MSLFSPMQMVDFTVYRFALEVAEDFKHEKNKALEFSGRMNLEQRGAVETENRQRLVLRATFNEEDPEFENQGFRVLSTVGAIFDVEKLQEQYPEPGAWEGFLLVNGGSILYTMLRQMIGQAAAQSPLRRLILPTVNMSELMREATKEESEPAKPAKATPKKATPKKKKQPAQSKG